MSSHFDEHGATGGKPPCRICADTMYRPFAIKNGFHLERCQGCGLVQVTDDLSKVNLAEYYDQEFFDETYDWLQEAGPGRRKEYRKFNYRLEEIEALKPQKGVILDIGCSFGFFLDVARTRGWHPVGVEIGEYAARFAREKLSLEVHIGDLLEAPLEEGRFDAITMWNVLEHLNDPLAQFRRINALLKPGGLIVFTTGDVDSYIRRIEGLRWRALIPPIHVANYSFPVIERMFERTGFEVAKRSVALPREADLKAAGLIGVFKALRFSDKMMIFGRKIASLDHTLESSQ